VKINNFAVSLDAQYFNLQRDFTEAKLSRKTENFESNASLDINKLELNSAQRDSAYNELSVELSKVILKNINLEANRPMRDILEESYTHEEHQALNFQVQAYIQSDSKEMAISLNVSLSRRFLQKTDLRLESLQKLKDPIVFSFDGRMPSLSTQTFSFDIDSDGKPDQISQLQAGSAFLALDKNSNGIIDNGSELFGTQSGDGFADLSKYDDDKNGWIDENDAIFDKLQIWQKTDTKDKLIGLGEVGIGAIFLGDTATPFSLKSETNQLLGEIRKSSFVLFENGRAGVISQIDLAINDETKEGLNTLDSLQKNLSSLNIGELYTKPQEQTSNTTDDKMQKIQGKIKALEGELRGAKESEKPALQARIGALYGQMMALLETQLT